MAATVEPKQEIEDTEEIEAVVPTTHRILTAEEFAALQRYLAEPPRQPTPALRHAVETYRRMMAERVGD